MTEQSKPHIRRPCGDAKVDIRTRQRTAEAGRVACALGAVSPERPEGDPEMLERSVEALGRLSIRTSRAAGIAPDQAAEIAQIYTDAAQLLRVRDPLAMRCALNRAAGVCIGTCGIENDE